MLHNIAHIKAFWIMQGIGLSQIALDWGCDDLDGTVVWYDITKREGDRGTTHQELHENDIKTTHPRSPDAFPWSGIRSIDRSNAAKSFSRDRGS